MVDIIPRWAGQLIPGVTARGSSNGVYLTFDDGPDPAVTSQILDILNSASVTATFFILGARAVQYPAIIRRMIMDGHAVGIHGWDHRSLALTGLNEADANLRRCRTIISEITDRTPTLFRPPYGRLGLSLYRACRRLGLDIVLWSLDPRDYRPVFNPSVLVRRIRRRVAPGDIVLLHDCGARSQNTIAALPAIIGGLRERNLQPSALRIDPPKTQLCGAGP